MRVHLLSIICNRNTWLLRAFHFYLLMHVSLISLIQEVLYAYHLWKTIKIAGNIFTYFTLVYKNDYLASVGNDFPRGTDEIQYIVVLIC